MFFSPVQLVPRPCSHPRIYEVHKDHPPHFALSTARPHHSRADALEHLLQCAGLNICRHVLHDECDQALRGTKG
jgi:hypothetical protein